MKQFIKKVAHFCFAMLLIIISCIAPACTEHNAGSDSSQISESNSPAADNKNTELSCTLYIECTTIFGNMDKFNKDKAEVLPKDGIILEKCNVSFKDGESVYDVMVRELKNRKIHMESTYTPVYDSAYVEGINNIYEFDCGEGSGWTYSVNGDFPNYSCSKYQLNANDIVVWHYTCDFGVDVGCSFDAEAAQTPSSVE